jgi:tripartite motif-containing protein 2/3
VERECEGLQYQVEVRNITQRIGSLSEKLDAAGTLGEPRENAFLTCDFTHNDSYTALETALSKLGRVRTSTTFPSLCTAQLNGPAVMHLETTAVLRTVSKMMSQTDQFCTENARIYFDLNEVIPLCINFVYLLYYM